MSIVDAIKKSVLEGFNTSISGLDILFGLGASLLAALFILYIYQRTMRQSALNRSFCISLLLVCCISSMMVLTITSSLALSLGMVGALSIIRFRTAVKDASDTAFLFWSVAAGITSGAGFFLLTLAGCLFVGLVCILCVILFDKMGKPFLLVVRMNTDVTAEQIEQLLKQRSLSFSLSSHVQNNSYTEVIYEMGSAGGLTAVVSELKQLPGITNVSLVDCQKG